MRVYPDGARVKRLENREDVNATVIGYQEPNVYELSYDEGGSGWWPEDAIEPLIE